MVVRTAQAAATTAAVECSGYQILFSTFLKDKTNVVKTLATDSIDKVNSKWLYMADRLSVDLGVFDRNGVVKNDHWNGVVEVLKTFLSSYPNAFSIMEVTARVDSGDMDIFSHTHSTVASRVQIAQWIAESAS